VVAFGMAPMGLRDVIWAAVSCNSNGADTAAVISSNNEDITIPFAMLNEMGFFNIRALHAFMDFNCLLF
jgi:hypothetical protein